MEERLECLTDGVSMLASLSLEDTCEGNIMYEGTEVTAERQYFDGNTSQSSTGISSEETPDSDSSSGCREHQLDFVSKEVQQLKSSCGMEEQSDLVTEPVTPTQCDSLEGSGHCVPDDTSLDQSGVKNHEVDSVPVIQNDPNVKHCDGSSHGNVDDEQLDLFMNDIILPLMCSRLCEDCESSPRYMYVHLSGPHACC
jgi:hypothetical protein